MICICSHIAVIYWYSLYEPALEKHHNHHHKHVYHHQEEQSGSVVECGASPALPCVLKQDILYLLVLVKPRKTCHEMNEKLLTGT